MKLCVLIHTSPEGGFWAEVPCLPGCATEGDTLEELRANLCEAIGGCSCDSPGGEIPKCEIDLFEEEFVEE